MNQKEINELRRRWQPDKNAISHIYACFVSGSDKRIISDLEEPLSLMNQDEAEKYLSFLKKTLSGSLGKNLIDIVFSTQQVVDSDEHRLLSGLRASKLKDRSLRHEFYQRVIQSLNMDGGNYLLLMACDTYDVPHRDKNDELQADASDEAFSYFLCCVCPVKEIKPALHYFPGDNEFQLTAGQVVSAPELGFLFPAFDDRSANIYNALLYSRKPAELHQEFIDAIFHTDPPMSSAEQREAFEGALRDALNDSCSMDLVQGVYEQLSAKIAEHKESKIPEPLTMTPKDVGAILRDCRVPEGQIADFQTECEKQFGVDAVLKPANLIDAGKFVVKTEHAAIAVDPAHSYQVESRIINGKPYILIPVGEGVEINGIAVKVQD